MTLFEDANDTDTWLDEEAEYADDLVSAIAGDS